MPGSTFTPFESATVPLANTKWSWLIWVRAAGAGGGGSVGLLVLGLLRLRDLVGEQPELRGLVRLEQA